jgi:hypothetical protein
VGTMVGNCRFYDILGMHTFSTVNACDIKEFLNLNYPSLK